MVIMAFQVLSSAVSERNMGQQRAARGAVDGRPAPVSSGTNDQGQPPSHSKGLMIGHDGWAQVNRDHFRCSPHVPYGASRIFLAAQVMRRATLRLSA
jgi:hypothetical protein